MAKCNQCGADIRFVRSATTGKSIPLDPKPVDIGGNVWLEDGVAHVLKKGERHPGPLFLSHFATCPKRTANRPATNRVADPLQSVKQIRREIEEERRAAKRDQTDSDEADSSEDAQLRHPSQGDRALPRRV